MQSPPAVVNRRPRRQVFVAGVIDRGPQRQVFVAGVIDRGAVDARSGCRVGPRLMTSVLRPKFVQEMSIRFVAGHDFPPRRMPERLKNEWALVSA